jgi:hypothetical protein
LDKNRLRTRLLIIAGSLIAGPLALITFITMISTASQVFSRALSGDVTALIVIIGGVILGGLFSSEILRSRRDKGTCD